MTKGASLVIWNHNSTTGKLEVLLHQRSRHVEGGKLKLGVPGGKKENTDANFEETALREGSEETGKRLIKYFYQHQC